MCGPGAADSNPATDRTICCRAGDMLCSFWK